MAAFYADCQREVRPVRTGYRVTFTCNLLLDSDPVGEVPVEPSAEAARYLAEHFTTGSPGGKATTVAAEAAYLPAGPRVHSARLSWDRLKGADAERAALLRAPLRMRVRGGARAYRD